MMNLAVQTLWTKPLGLANDFREHTFFGFKDQDTFMASAYLSFEMLKKNGYDVHLYCDKYGKELLCDKLGLKYDYVDTCHDNLSISPKIWAFCKLYTHLKQTQPYIHVDLDAYLIKDLPQQIKESNILYQNLEWNNIFYIKMWDELRPHITSRSTLFNKIRTIMDGKKSFGAMNVGVFGGNDVKSIKIFAEDAVRFMNNNLTSMPEECYSHFCIFVEQMYCYYYFHFNGIKSLPLDRSLSKHIEDFVDWDTYTHLIGDCKLFPDRIEEMITLSKKCGYK